MSKKIISPGPASLPVAVMSLLSVAWILIISPPAASQPNLTPNVLLEDWKNGY